MSEAATKYGRGGIPFPDELPVPQDPPLHHNALSPRKQKRSNTGQSPKTGVAHGGRSLTAIGNDSATSILSAGYGEEHSAYLFQQGSEVVSPSGGYLGRRIYTPQQSMLDEERTRSSSAQSDWPIEGITNFSRSASPMGNSLITRNNSIEEYLSSRDSLPNSTLQHVHLENGELIPAGCVGPEFVMVEKGEDGVALTSASEIHRPVAGEPTPFLSSSDKIRAGVALEDNTMITMAGVPENNSSNSRPTSASLPRLSSKQTIDLTLTPISEPNEDSGSLRRRTSETALTTGAIRPLPPLPSSSQPVWRPLPQLPLVPSDPSDSPSKSKASPARPPLPTPPRSSRSSLPTPPQTTETSLATSPSTRSSLPIPPQTTESPLATPPPARSSLPIPPQTTTPPPSTLSQGLAVSHNSSRSSSSTLSTASLATVSSVSSPTKFFELDFDVPESDSPVTVNNRRPPLIKITTSSPHPLDVSSPLLLDVPVPPSPRTAKRRQVTKLSKLLGEKVPLEFVNDKPLPHHGRVLPSAPTARDPKMRKASLRTREQRSRAIYIDDGIPQEFNDPTQHPELDQEIVDEEDKLRTSPEICSEDEDMGSDLDELGELHSWTPHDAVKFETAALVRRRSHMWVLERKGERWEEENFSKVLDTLRRM